jgi:hypothetical protein
MTNVLTVPPIELDRPAVAAPSDASPPASNVAEGALIGRFIAILTPIFAVAAGWVAGVVAQAIPGAHLDQSQIVAFMVAAMTSTLTAGWKYLQGWQQHERLVSEGRAAPVKPVPVPAEAPAA